MALDGHIHIGPGEPDPDDLLVRMGLAGINGGVIISLPPASYHPAAGGASAQERLKNLMAWTGGRTGMYPFFWIDPTEDDALGQVEAALAADVAGFKVIPDRYYPGDERAMPVYRAIAAAGRPILFHSGILWDGKPSSRYCRPAEFEAMLEVPGLRFALAHVAWPWCDELIAVYGKFRQALKARPELGVELFVDLTPGTPPIYRQEVLTKLLTVGYEVERNVFFGSDCSTSRYDADAVEAWTRRDREVYRALEMPREAQHAIFGENLLRFVQG